MPIGTTVADDARRQLREIDFRDPGAQLHLAAPGEAEQHPGARADHLAGFDVALEHQSGRRRDDVEPRGTGLGLAELGAGNPHPGVGGVARRGQPIDVGLGDETALDQLERAVEVGLGEIGIGLATWICAPRLAACWVWTERSITARTWPWLTQSPASTSTRTICPPSPTEPTGSSRRARQACRWR